jgi:uncharacterized protein (DUF433 family)
MKFTRITVDPQQMGGVPCIRQLRIPLTTVVSMVAQGMTELEILIAYPDLEAADITESLLYNSHQKMKGYSIHSLITEIDLLMNLDSALDLGRLEVLLDLYFNHSQAEEFLDVWFRLYERFPDDESEGVFWSILHSIENYPSFDRLVVKSVLRCPSEFPVMMVNRMLNAGIEKVNDLDLLELLDGVATNDIYALKIREAARDYMDYQRNKLEDGRSPPSKV